jgi:two-component system LytT family response regulator
LVDDEQKALNSLSQVLNTFFNDIEILGTASNIEDAYQQIIETRPHLVFLDIEMGSRSGFQLLEKFDEIDFHVAFVTAHEEFALQAIKFSAIDYIIKPAGISDLKVLLDKVRKDKRHQSDGLKVKHMFGNFLTEDRKDHKITLPVSDGFEFVRIDDILYLRADGAYTLFKLKDGNDIVASRNLKFFEEILNNYGFYRIHNSTLINLKYIKKVSKVQGGSVIMEDDTEWGISRARKDDFLKLMSIR